MDSTVNCMTFASQAGGDSVCTVMHILYGLSQLQGLACWTLEMKLKFVLKIYEIVEDVHWICLKHYVLCVDLEHLFFANYVIKKVFLLLLCGLFVFWWTILQFSSEMLETRW